MLAIFPFIGHKPIFPFTGHKDRVKKKEFALLHISQLEKSTVPTAFL